MADKPWEQKYETPDGKAPWEQQYPPAGGAGDIKRPTVDMKSSVLPPLVKGAIQTVPGAAGAVGGALAGSGLGPAGAIAGAGLGGAAGETASQGLENLIFKDGVSPTSKEGLIRTGIAGAGSAALEGATQLHPIEAAKALIPNKVDNALRALVHGAPEPEIGAMSKLVTTPGEVPAIGEQSKIPVRPGFSAADARPGAKGKLLVTPGEPGQGIRPDTEAATRGPVIIAPEPVKTPIGGPKTAFSLVKGAPLNRATEMGVEGAADINSVRTGRPLIYTPREGVGYPGPRAEESARLIERRASPRSKLMSPKEIEEAMKLRRLGDIRTPFDDTEGASDTMNKDIVRNIGGR